MRGMITVCLIGNPTTYGGTNGMPKHHSKVERLDLVQLQLRDTIF